ncbi:hypothetical protein F4677DRAFT_88944 [Hypoxylon crocopeplum]|nr:hypothetical protein F4677DRAFT_88944 [Hypoxylon crocopeplum]
MLSSFWKPSSTPPPADKMPGGPPTNDNTAPPAPLVSAWRARADAREPVAVVRVRNLQGTIPVGRDAWGREGKLQPVLLSSEVSFAQPFSGSSTSASGTKDRLDAGTVHYGNLSKTLLGSLEMWGQGGKGTDGKRVVVEGKGGSGGAEAETHIPRTADVFELLWVRMTGRVVDGSRIALPLDQLPFLDAAKLRSLSLTVHLPKASLLGVGVSLTTMASFRDDALKEGEDEGEGDNNKNPLRSYSRTLRIQGIHVPTLIGVNSNEREAKQMVIADVEIDRFDVTDDIHSDLERTIFEVSVAMETSSFETLEALATQVANKILSDFRIGDSPAPMKERGWQVKVCLEKPVAVPFAECPAVEVTMGS